MFGDWLDEALTRRGWSPAQLAREAARLGGRVSAACVAELCSGKRKSPETELVILLARALGVPPGEALIATGRKGPVPPPPRFERPLLVGITGGSGAGKSCLATWIVGLLGQKLARRIEADWYLRPARPGSSPAAREAKNYDVPAAYETERLVRDLRALRRGRVIRAPQYDFEHHDRAPTRHPVQPAPVLVVEGLFLFHEQRLRDLFDLKLFVEAGERTCFQRRRRRDRSERGRTACEVRMRFYEHAQPGYEKYIAPTRAFADLILHNAGDDLQLPPGLQAVVAWIRQRHAR